MPTGLVLIHHCLLPGSSRQSNYDCDLKPGLCHINNWHDHQSTPSALESGALFQYVSLPSLRQAKYLVNVFWFLLPDGLGTWRITQHFVTFIHLSNNIAAWLQSSIHLFIFESTKIDAMPMTKMYATADNLQYEGAHWSPSFHAMNDCPNTMVRLGQPRRKWQDLLRTIYWGVCEGKLSNNENINKIAASSHTRPLHQITHIRSSECKRYTVKMTKHGGGWRMKCWACCCPQQGQDSSGKGSVQTWTSSFVRS